MTIGINWAEVWKPVWKDVWAQTAAPQQATRQMILASVMGAMFFTFDDELTDEHILPGLLVNVDPQIPVVVPPVTPPQTEQYAGGYWPDYGPIRRRPRRKIEDAVSIETVQANIETARISFEKRKEARRLEKRSQYVKDEIRKILDEQDRMELSIEALKMQLENANLADEEILLILALAG